MAYVLIFAGIALGYLDYLGSGNLSNAGSLLSQEMFGGTSPFYKWVGAIVILGLLGYIPEVRPIAMSMLVLVILAIVLSHTAAFSNLEKAL
jgi:hypothetical protein